MALLRRRARPGAQRGAGGLDGVVDLRGGRLRIFADHVAGVGGVEVAGDGGASRPFAGDVVFVQVGHRSPLANMSAAPIVRSRARVFRLSASRRQTLRRHRKSCGLSTSFVTPASATSKVAIRSGDKACKTPRAPSSPVKRPTSANSAREQQRRIAAPAAINRDRRQRAGLGRERRAEPVHDGRRRLRHVAQHHDGAGDARRQRRDPGPQRGRKPLREIGIMRERHVEARRAPPRPAPPRAPSPPPPAAPSRRAPRATAQRTSGSPR